jgi:hypothetical protein
LGLALTASARVYKRTANEHTHTQALKTGQAVVTRKVDMSDGVMTTSPESKPTASYFRPGGKNMGERWWYNAVLTEAYNVQDKTGKKFQVAAVN